MTSGHENVSRPLNPDWSIRIPRAPALCKVEKTMYVSPTEDYSTISLANRDNNNNNNNNNNYNNNNKDFYSADARVQSAVQLYMNRKDNIEMTKTTN